MFFTEILTLLLELLRKGRFDDVFYVGFPHLSERKSILKIYLKNDLWLSLSNEELGFSHLLSAIEHIVSLR